MAGGRKNRGEDWLGKGRKTPDSCFGGARISVEGWEGSKSLLLEHTHKDTGHRAGRTHKDVPDACRHAPRWGSKLLAQAPLPCVSFYGLWGKAEASKDPHSSERPPGMDP